MKKLYKSELSRSNRRRIAKLLRYKALIWVEAGDDSQLHAQGLCHGVDVLLIDSKITPKENADLETAIRFSLQSGEEYRLWLPDVLYGYRATEKLESKSRQRWLNHWAETGEALTHKQFNSKWTEK